ncbi:SusC/RagA family TonB-linked outer membrane protein [Mucilaginibacter sp. KACC 22063]|uniref:SusC/RagA family TonB-linked outer membrane protein n=1 Tax=Mucilaginibacter sp. KACC 22063 TaxID=3025666 RepID=UPI002366264E|nr:TonB-dependent receptor [Mucilaginibacter sp. KACC 22063]WDF56630.1 TonB-dependent receptor [Mucilaginibacter sp. KACC 22063]
MFKSLLLKARVLCLLLCCLLSSLVVTAQTKITGRVIGSDDRQPIVGAAVRIKGTQEGTVTDVNGNFSINARSGQSLVITYVGYTAQEVAVTGQPSYNVTLQVNNKSLNEVVVTGYTAQRKKDIAGAVATVSVNDAKKIPTSSTDQILQGQASGVTVVTSGAPGAGSNVFVRGISSIGNSSPLYVIDGVQTTSMSDLNPNDIESISVLKDAGSAAIYGVSGGNGVVVITTKKGRSGKSTISYDGFYGTQVPPGGNVWHILTPQDMSRLTYVANDAATYNKIYPGGPGTIPTYGWNGTQGSGAGSNIDLSLYRFDANNPSNDFLIQKFNQAGTDWFHEIYKSAPIQNHTISASGGNEKNQYFMSLGYLNQQGTLIETYLKRYQARVNTTFAITDHIRVGETANIYYRETPFLGNINPSSFYLPGYGNQQEGNAISMSYRIMPQIPVYDIGGNYGGTYTGPGGEPLGNASNPVANQVRAKDSRDKSWTIQGNAFAEVDFLKHFTARTLFGGTVISDWQYGFSALNAYNDYEAHNSSNGYREQSQYQTSYNWSNTLNYKQVFGKHNINALAGYEQRLTVGRYIGGTSTDLFSVVPDYGNVSNGTKNNVASSYAFQPTSIQSLFARVDYIYNDKYIIGGTIRRDGYSGFGNKKWGNFPAAVVAWRLSQEDFMKGISWLNDLKIRGSYGEAGSYANTPGNNSLTLYGAGFGTSYYAVNGTNVLQQGFYNNQIGNPATSWETDKIANIGFDATIIKNLDVSVEFYKKTVSGLLFPQPLPATVGGASVPFVNLGNIQNKGIDFSATYHGRAGSDFTYNIGATLTTYKNKISNIPGTGYVDLSGSRVGTITRDANGQPIGTFYGYKVIGIYNSNAEAATGATYDGAAAGSFKYADINGDGKINSDDRTFIGNPNPDFTYGLNLSATYKGFDFTTVLYGSQGNDDFNYTKYFTDFYPSFVGAKSSAALYNSWGSPGVTNPTVTKATYSQTMGSTIPSTYYVENGSFLKMRVLQIGYTINPNLLKRVGISKVHIYLQGTNLFTITKYDGLDPELQPSTANGVSGNYASGAFGIDYGSYPNNQRQYILGLNLTF